MVPLILFFSVVAVGVLGLCAMFVFAKQHVVASRRAGALERLKAEYAENVIKRQPRALPRAAEAVSLTQVFSLLEQSAELPCTVEPAAPRKRMAKGSAPIPVKDPRPAVPGAYPTVIPVPRLPVVNARTAPLSPVVSARPAVPSPRRAARSVPPPIPGVRFARSSGRG